MLPKTRPQTLEQALGLIAALQSDLDSLQEQLAWSNRLSSLGTLTAGLAHEYNNLLTPIGTYAQLALANPGNRDLAQKALRASASGAQQAGRLADAILGFAAPGTQAPHTSCSIDQVVSHTLQCLAPILKQEKVSTTTDIEDQRVAIDSLALQQVLLNLIGNARHAMRSMPGDRRIALSARGNAGRCEIDVIDNGPGIPSDMIDQLFVPFVSQRSADGSANETNGSQDAAMKTESTDGTGLGLSICKTLIESAGGRITLESPCDRGAHFRIELPRVE